MKSIIIAAALLLGFSTQAPASAGVYRSETVLEDRVCHTVPERQTGTLIVHGNSPETIKFITPEHEECTYVPTRRIRSTTHYSR